MKIVSHRPTITRKDLESVLDCLINEDLTAGNTVRAFENGIAERTGMKHSLAVNSLTAAYHLVFLALELKNGDEVILPSLCSPEPLCGLNAVGAQPVLVDSGMNSPFPEPQEIKNKITNNTRAIITGHLFGFQPALEDLNDTGIPVIEDISHSLGVCSPEGITGMFAVASFSPSMIITTGNGGIVLTGSARHNSMMKELQGSGKSAANYDYTMTDFQAAMGISQLAKLDDFIRRRRAIAGVYHNALKISPHRALMHFNEHGAYQSFPVMFDSSAEKIAQYFKKNGIEIGRPLEKPLHAVLGVPGGGFPNSERLARKIYSPPLYPALSRLEVEKITKALSKFI